VIQDRSFNADGSLFYPGSREFFDGFGGPYVPGSDVPPIWNPEFFGNAIVVNGRTWPYLEVEPRRYRFRVLNGCDSRFLVLKIVGHPLAPRPAPAALPVWQIGADGGFLRAPAMLDQLLVAPAERADVIVDFTGLRAGTALYLINEGPDEPFGGGVANTDFAAADPLTTGQVMKFTVVPLVSRDRSIRPEQLALPAPEPLGHARRTRQLSLNEDASTIFDGPVAAKLGTLDAGGNPVALRWEDPITEDPGLGATEVWEIHNFTEDAHPIHVHQVQFQVVDRQPMDAGSRPPGPTPHHGRPRHAHRQPMDGARRPPESWETGRKDTVIAFPGEITRVKARFELPGLYVWHCHILEHEDNEMMRPYVVGPNHHRDHQSPHGTR
jgi:bilirubin oxidase